MYRMRHRVFRFLVLLVVVALTVPSLAMDAEVFKIGTGGNGGTYYPIGQIVAGIVGSPPGASPCTETDNCGIPGLTAVALTSLGSVANVEGVSLGELGAAFVQSDVAFWAHSGTGLYADKQPHKNIRAIASLYPESIHLVARRIDGVETLDHLKNRVVALGAQTSGTLVDARLVLVAAGLDEKTDFKLRYFSPDVAAEKINKGEIDTFFSVAGYPSSAVSRAIDSGSSHVLPIDGMAVEFMLLEHGFLSRDIIPAGVYGNSADIPTVAVNALIIVSATADEEFIYRLTKALWRKGAGKLLQQGHPKGKRVTVESALDGIGIPLHSGAKRYYRENGKLK